MSNQDINEQNLDEFDIEKILIQAAFNGLFPDKPILTDTEMEIFYNQIVHQRNAYDETSMLPKLFNYEKHFSAVEKLIEAEQFEQAEHLLTLTPPEAVNTPLYTGMEWELHHSKSRAQRYDEAIEPYKDYQLCYGEDLKLWFTSDMEKQTGDDWNDSPWCWNAGEPYCHIETDIVCLEFYNPILKNITLTDCETLTERDERGLYSGLHSVDSINKHLTVPWLQISNTDLGMSCELYGYMTLEKVMERIRKMEVTDCLLRLCEPNEEDCWQMDTLKIFNHV